jgi:hypothetical protein
MLNFVYGCLNSKSLLVNFIVRHGIQIGAMNSIIGRNVLNCSQRYQTSIDCIYKLEFSPFNIDKFVVESDENLITADLLSELLQCRDGLLYLSDYNFSFSDLQSMIHIICTG